jgi:hypothetical protein
MKAKKKNESEKEGAGLASYTQSTPGVSQPPEIPPKSSLILPVCGLNLAQVSRLVRYPPAVSHSKLYSYSSLLMTLYLIPTVFVFSTALQAFLKDESTPNHQVSSWVLVVVAALLWPVTLPAIINHRWHDSFESDKSN